MDITPFPYQLDGADWLSCRRHGLLADEMGLGKTVQAVMAARAIGAERIVAVCPAVARFTWVRHFEWAGYKAHAVVSRRTYRDDFPATVVSYNLVDPEVHAGKIDVLILDECHFLKSLDAERTKNVYGKRGLIHQSSHVWNLSGTPAPNHAGELWPMLYVFGVYKHSYEAFVAEFCTQRETPFGTVITGTKNIPKLRALVAPFMLRRKKVDVLKDLPPITFADLPLSGAPVDFSDLEGMDIEALEAIYDSVSALRRHVGLSKVESIVELVQAELDAGVDKIVLFAIHRDVIAQLESALSTYGAVSLHGGTSPVKREHNIQSFQTDPKCRVFIGQIIAAGTAINLTAASQAIFVESDWVPGNNAQAAMRIHRIGQTRPVLIRFASLGGSLDEQIQAVVRRKTRQLVELFDESDL